jgi:hypothetical protein
MNADLQSSIFCLDFTSTFFMMQGSHGSVDEYSNLLHCAISATKQLQLS